jgi:hypothetical protein
MFTCTPFYNRLRMQTVYSYSDKTIAGKYARGIDKDYKVCTMCYTRSLVDTFAEREEQCEPRAGNA